MERVNWKEAFIARFAGPIPNPPTLKTIRVSGPTLEGDWYGWKGCFYFISFGLETCITRYLPDGSSEVVLVVPGKLISGPSQGTVEHESKGRIELSSLPRKLPNESFGRGWFRKTKEAVLPSSPDAVWKGKPYWITKKEITVEEGYWSFKTIRGDWFVGNHHFIQTNTGVIYEHSSGVGFHIEIPLLKAVVGFGGRPYFLTGQKILISSSSFGNMKIVTFDW